MTNSTICKIVVRGGTFHGEPVVVPCSLERPLEIIGEDPSPIIDVSSSPQAALSLQSGGGGTLSNFVIRHGKMEKGMEGKRPSALEILRGEWNISSCRVSCASGCGIYVASVDASPSVSNCTVIDVLQAGLYITDGAKGSYVKLTITSCGYSGILLKRGANPTVADCDVHGGSETGLFCHESFGVIEGNIVSGNSGCGIVVKGTGASPIIRKNKIHGNAQAGIFCCESCAPTISDNEIIGNHKAGVIVKTSGKPLVVRNRIAQGKEAGVFVFEDGEGTFEDNEILDNANAGILVTTRGKPFVAHNSVRGNHYEGVWVCKGGSGTFRENDLRGNQKGPRDVEAGTTSQWFGNRET
jgi:parallel beta-helix repeat protein